MLGRGIYSDTLQYAIRPTIRNHSLLKRDVVINTIANLIDKSHKVSLTNPDKVILVELYQVSVLPVHESYSLVVDLLSSIARSVWQLGCTISELRDAMSSRLRSSADACICYFGVGTFTVLEGSTT